MPQFHQALSKCTSELSRVIASICHQKEWSDLNSLLGQFFDSDFKYVKCLATDKCLHERSFQASAVSMLKDWNRCKSWCKSIRLFSSYWRYNCFDKELSTAMFPHSSVLILDSFELKMVNNASRGYHLIVSSKNREFLSEWWSVDASSIVIFLIWERSEVLRSL